MKYNAWEFKVYNYLRMGTQNLLKQNVDFHIKRNKREHYIGMSNLTECARLIWMRYHHPELLPNKFDEQTLRIFDLGHLIEDITLKTLIAGGAQIESAQTELSDFNNILRGHTDAVLDNECVLEVKSMNDGSFASFKHLGCKISHRTYYVQTQMYMHYSKLKDAIVVATNKNNSDVYCEHIPFDQDTVDFHLSKVEHIVNANKFYSIQSPYIPNSIDECTRCPLKRLCYPSTSR